MIAEDLLARLERVRKSGPRSWSARCPSHADKGPSLRVTDTDDGKILIHCFAGCSPAEIVGAIGVNLSDLFPPRNAAEARVYSQQRFVKGTLKELQQELWVALLIMRDVGGDRASKSADTIAKLLRELQRT